MRYMTVRTSVLHWSTLAFLAVTGILDLARAQQAPQPEGGATDEINLPLMDARSSVTWNHGPLGNQTESLFARLGFAHFSVVTEQSFSNNILGLPFDAGPFWTDGKMAIYARAYGFSTDTNPVSGSGRWQGRVVGIDIGRGETHGNQILGDAAVVLADFTDPRVDVQFSGLLDLVTGSTHPNIQWKDVPVGQGTFGLEADSGDLQVYFFGPEHQGVGGKFLRGSILGAFGAIRIRDTLPPGSDGPVTVGLVRFLDSTEARRSFAAGFDVGVRFRPGGASTSRVRLDYSVRDGATAFDGEAGFSIVRLADSQAYVSRHSYQRGDPSEHLLTASAIFGWSNQSRVFSRGMAASANPPPGTATWVGAVAAMNPLDPATTVRGDALVRIDDFSEPVAFVALTNLREDSTRLPRHDIYWNRIPVTRGAFHGKTAGGWIRGRFHGPSQDEVAGTFFRPALTGAFGASRTPELTGQRAVDASIPIDLRSATAFQMVGRMSGSAVPIFSLGGLWYEGVGDVVTEISEQAFRIASLGTSMPDFEWVARTTTLSRYWLGTLFTSALDAVEELPYGESSYTLRPLPDGSFGVIRYDATGAGDRIVTQIAGFAFGAAQFSNPLSGAATWTGEVLGLDVTDGDTFGNQIAGIATLRIGDFADPKVDVAFTGLKEMRTRTAIADMTWSAVPLEAGGFRSEQSGLIEGQMYGADHSHVGGVFERDGTIGAFGAVRGSGPPVP